MASEDINVNPYYGSLVATDFLSGSVNVILPYIGESEPGTLDDTDGWLSSDDGTTTFNGETVSYIGSGVATPGVETLGLLIATGPSVDVVVFEAGGQIYFHYPNGEPNLTGSLLLNLDISCDPYHLFTPICFTAGTMILTPSGEVAIETLSRGDLVTDIDGVAHKVRWIGQRRLSLPKSGYFDKWRPIRIAADTFGDGCPSRTTRLSQEHRVLLQDWRANLYFHEDSVLAAAKFLTNDNSIVVDRSLGTVVYFHILCDAHVILVANGLPAESLLLGSGTLTGMSEAARAEVVALFPDLALDEGTRPMQAARRVVPGRKAALLI